MKPSPTPETRPAAAGETSAAGGPSSSIRRGAAVAAGAESAAGNNAARDVSSGCFRGSGGGSEPVARVSATPEATGWPAESGAELANPAGAAAAAGRSCAAGSCAGPRHEVNGSFPPEALAPTPEVRNCPAESGFKGGGASGCAVPAATAPQADRAPASRNGCHASFKLALAASDPSGAGCKSAETTVWEVKSGSKETGAGGAAAGAGGCAFNGGGASPDAGRVRASSFGDPFLAASRSSSASGLNNARKRAALTAAVPVAVSAAAPFSVADGAATLDGWRHPKSRGKAS